jgi:hypothetical protein
MNLSSNAKTCIGKPFTGQPTPVPTPAPTPQPKTKSNDIGKPTNGSGKHDNETHTENTTVIPTTQENAVAAKREGKYFKLHAALLDGVTNIGIL